MPTRQDEKSRRKMRALGDRALRARYDKGYAHWTECRIEGRLPLVRGRRFQVTGHSGWFMFMEAGRDRGGDFLCGAGPFTKKSTEVRGSSFHFCPSRVRKVERAISPYSGSAETRGEAAERLGLN